MNKFAELQNELEQIDILVANGWRPCINQLDGGTWHVGLEHVSCGKPEQITTVVDGVTRISWGEMDLHVHGRSDTLKGALIEAINKANSALSFKH